MSLQLNNYQIKLLAAIFMVIDHVGVVFFPGVEWLRLIGRLSFPLFAWLLAEGERHTRDVGQYLIRLLLLGVISQPIYQIALAGAQFNILFILALGLVTLRLSRRFQQYSYLIWAAGIIAAELLRLEYGAYGMVVIGLMAHFSKRRYWWWGCWLGLHLFLAIAPTGFGLTQVAAVVTPVLLLWVNYQRGPAARWFYGFYPVHMLVLWLLKNIGTQPF